MIEPTFNADLYKLLAKQGWRFEEKTLPPRKIYKDRPRRLFGGSEPGLLFIHDHIDDGKRIQVFRENGDISVDFLIGLLCLDKKSGPMRNRDHVLDCEGVYWPVSRTMEYWIFFVGFTQLMVLAVFLLLGVCHVIQIDLGLFGEYILKVSVPPLWLIGMYHLIISFDATAKRFTAIVADNLHYKRMTK